MACCPKCGHRLVSSQSRWQIRMLNAGRCCGCGRSNQDGGTRCRRCKGKLRRAAKRRYRLQQGNACALRIDGRKKGAAA